MIQKIKTLLLAVMISGGLLIPAVGMAGVAYAADPAAPAGPDIQSQLKTGACLNTTGCADDTVKPEGRVNGLIKDVINIFSLVVGVVAVIMIIIGGLRYIISGGESGNVTGAKNTILYAIIGLVVVALAQIIVRFVLDRVTTAPAG